MVVVVVRSGFETGMETFFIVNHNSDNALSNKLLSNIMYTDAILNIYSRYTFNTLTSNSFVLQLPYPLHR